MRSRGLRGFLFLWIQLLVLSERQEVAQDSAEGHKIDMFSKEAEKYMIRVLVKNKEKITATLYNLIKFASV
ncbi:hypothetical protein [Paenibacillus qinlingensis]|nr:hypothetical protein [Paenibacillus qinlingensis]